MSPSDRVQRLLLALEDEEELAIAGETIRVVPAYKYFCERLQEPLRIGALC